MFKPNKRDTYLKKKEMEMFCFKAVPRPCEKLYLQKDDAAVAVSQQRVSPVSAVATLLQFAGPFSAEAVGPESAVAVAQQ